MRATLLEPALWRCMLSPAALTGTCAHSSLDQTAKPPYSRCLSCITLRACVHCRSGWKEVGCVACIERTVATVKPLRRTVVPCA